MTYLLTQDLVLSKQLRWIVNIYMSLKLRIEALSNRHSISKANPAFNNITQDILRARGRIFYGG
jgi:hypothetical protein